MNINNKLLQFIEYMNVSQRQFTKKCGLTETALRKSKSVGVESLVKIKQNYSMLSLDWLLFDKGPMILTETNLANEPPIQYGLPQNDCEKKLRILTDELHELQKKLNASQDKYIELLESNRLYKKQEGVEP